jgi:protein-S-isoprenylcysteine O-methyltransferase Ste14
VRHPHHLGIGLMVTSISLLVGGPITFLIASSVIWILIHWFLKTIEEPELVEKFGDEYLRYKEKVPGLFPRISCLFKELVKGVQ